jgi:YHS domain-containing protein
VPGADILERCFRRPAAQSQLSPCHFAEFRGCDKAAGQRCKFPERPGEEWLPNPYIWASDGRPTETEGTSEMKKYLIVSVLIVGFAGSAYAANGQFGNMCSWGLANHKDVQTDCSVNAAIKGKTYCFSSADAKSQFMKNPSSNLTKAESFYKSEHKG